MRTKREQKRDCSCYEVITHEQFTRCPSKVSDQRNWHISIDCYVMCVMLPRNCLYSISKNTTMQGIYSNMYNKHE